MSIQSVYHNDITCYEGILTKINEFITASRSPDGHGPYCRPCDNERSRQYRLSHYEKVRAREAKYQKNHPEVNRRAVKKRNLNKSEKRKMLDRHYKHKNTIQTFDRLPCSYCICNPMPTDSHGSW